MGLLLLGVVIGAGGLAFAQRMRADVRSVTKLVDPIDAELTAAFARHEARRLGRTRLRVVGGRQ